MAAGTQPAAAPAQAACSGQVEGCPDRCCCQTQEELSDASIVLSTQGEEEGADPVILQKLPGHTVLLSISPFFKATILRWQHKRARSAAQHGREVVLTLQDAEQLPAAMAVLAALYAVKPLPELLAELSDVQQLQAALLADMWQVGTCPVVARLALSQHVTVASLFDAVTTATPAARAAEADGPLLPAACGRYPRSAQLPRSTWWMQQNKAAPSPPDRVGLSDAVVHAFLDLAAFPPCVLPLLKLAAASSQTAE